MVRQVGYRIEVKAMTYGYCRISTKQQSIERQIRNIKAAYPDAEIIEEAFTGTKIERPAFDDMVKSAKELKEIGEDVTIVFDSVSRMSRNAEDGYNLYQDLYSRGINLVFLKEHHIDTDTYKGAMRNQLAMTGEDTDLIFQGINAYLLRLAAKQIKLAFEQAQKEVDDLHQRTKEGIQTAKLNGKQIGQKQGAKLTTQKSVTAKKFILKNSRTFNGSLDDKECIGYLKIAPNTFYKYKKELRAEQQ